MALCFTGYYYRSPVQQEDDNVSHFKTCWQDVNELNKVLDKLAQPHYRTKRRLKEEVEFLEILTQDKSYESTGPFAARFYGDMRRLRECRDEIERLKYEVLPLCGLPYLLPRLMSKSPLDMRTARQELSGLKWNKPWSPKLLPFLQEYFSAEYMPPTIQACRFQKVVCILHDFVSQTFSRKHLQENEAEFADLMKILKKRLRVVRLRRERYARLIQRACRVWLFRRTWAARVLQRKFLEYRFRPEGKLAQETVKSLHDLAVGE